MRNIAWAAVVMVAAIFTASAQPIALRTSILQWDNDNPWSEVANFTFTAYTPANASIGSASSVTNEMPIISIMGNAPNGTYYVNGFTLGTSGLTSENSTNFTFRWFGTIAIATHPASLTVKNAESATFTVTTIGGAGAVSYRWTKDGVNIAGATSASYTITSAKPSDNGNYAVTCSDSTGLVTSQIATLVVIPKPKSPVNIQFKP